MVISGQNGNLPDGSVNLLLLVPGLIMFAAGLLAFFTALVAFFKFKERSFVIYPTLIIGFFLSLFIFGEFLFPH